MNERDYAMNDTPGYRIWYADGDPLRTFTDAGDPDLPRPGQETFTAAEAAAIVTVHPYSWIRGDGGIVVGTYKTRCGANRFSPLTGRQMAARLRRRA